MKQIVKYLHYKVFNYHDRTGVWVRRWNPCDYEGKGKKKAFLRGYNLLMQDVFWLPIMRLNAMYQHRQSDPDYKIKYRNLWK